MIDSREQQPTSDLSDALGSSRIDDQRKLLTFKQQWNQTPAKNHYFNTDNHWLTNANINRPRTYHDFNTNKKWMIDSREQQQTSDLSDARFFSYRWPAKTLNLQATKKPNTSQEPLFQYWQTMINWREQQTTSDLSDVLRFSRIDDQWTLSTIQATKKHNTNEEPTNSWRTNND